VDHAARFHRILDERNQTGGRGIGDLPQANAPNPPSILLSRNHNQGFRFHLATPHPFLYSAQAGFIDFYRSGQAVAPRPEGPFRFSGVALRGTGQETWDKYGPHNPEIRFFEGKYVLLYIANPDYRQPPHPFNQSIGMAIADSPGGPWKKVGKDGMILTASPDAAHFTHGRQIVNPTLLRVGGRYHLYFKTAGVVAGTTVFGLAVSDRLEGPYAMRPRPITPKGVTIEDATAFEWKGKICLLTTDNHGDVTGVHGGGALWVSEDGVSFNPQWTQLGFDTIPAYLPGYDPLHATRVYGGYPKFERPKILTIDGKPAYLYASSGWNVLGGKRTVSYVLRIDLRPEDGPIGL
jgi:hypothetical protein